MLNDVLGYRSASIGDLWTGTTRLSPEVQKTVRHVLTGVFGKDAYKRMVTAESLLMNFVTDARVTIVVKSIIVPMANLGANIFQLMSRGVPIMDIARGFPKKTAEVQFFTKGRAKRIELEIELQAAQGDPIATRRIQTQLQAIRDANRRLSIWPLIEAGEFSAISDVGSSREDIQLAEGRLSEYLEKLTDKLPDSLKTMGRYGLVAKDTALYQGLQKAVEYGDFLGKAVLYDDLVGRKGLTPKEALAAISEEFVNYDRLPGRSRSYLEEIGMLWFWNFKIRSVKVGVSIIRNNPLHALLATGLPLAAGLELGSPVYDNGLSVLVDGRSHWSMGPAMGIHAHYLNPWVNLTGI